MLRQTMTLCIATSLTTWTLAASADEPSGVTTSPVPPESSVSGSDGSPPSDLPAPDTTAWVNKPLLITSSVVLVAGYVPVAVVGATSDRPSDQDNLFYPVVGPWMNLADRGCETRSCSNETLNTAGLIASGVGQGLGALGMLLSLALPGETTRNWFLVGNDRINAGPTQVGALGYGLGAAGTF